MSSNVNCPHCQHRSIVTQQHFGKTVKCPSCSNSFQVATPMPANEPETIQVNTSPPPLTNSESTSSSEEIRQRLMVPGIGLMVTGGLTTLMGLMFIPALLFPGLMGEQTPTDPLELIFNVFFMATTLILGIVMLHGSIKMIQLQSHSLSIAAGIAAMVPCYCCLLGLPMGIWALVVLQDSEVKRAFK